MLPPYMPLERIPAMARRAENLGFDLLACGEHVFFHVPAPNAFVALAAAAGATDRIRLLSAVTLLPTYPAALAAKMAATLDGVSGGRFELGIGVGGEYAPELLACGVDPSERGARTNEALKVMAHLFTGEPLTYEGRFARYEDVRLSPTPVQRPGPPIWVGGRKPVSLRRAAKYADIWMPYLTTPERLSEGLAAINSHPELPSERTVDGAVLCWSAVGSDSAVARRTASQALGEIYKQDFAGLGRYIPAGTSAEVAARMQEYGEAGAETVLFAPACPPEEFDVMVQMFAEEVAPLLR
ncbi:LLM class flavin-dependent oxidoreductase [Rhodococcus jostii]|uniref:LLM class flavin-dependent oxidoreductase n=1 Tax=Rhodococcus jostii TaxID=132919 RepID=UPI0036487015